MGMHVHFYFWAALVLLYVASFLCGLLLASDLESPYESLAVAVLTFSVFHFSFLFARRRCDAPDLSCWNALLLIAGYATIGITGASMFLAVLAVIGSVLSAIALSFASLLFGGRAFAVQRFRSVVIFASRHRMYQ